MNANDLEKVKHIRNYASAIPYKVSRTELYNADELYQGFNPKIEGTEDSYTDALIYKHYMDSGKQAVLLEESLCRAIHDHGIHRALREFFRKYDCHKCVGVMGGHANSRQDPMFRKVVLMSKQLTESGFYMLSGGGPGAMEATHLGAWMAGRTEAEVDYALEILSSAPTFRDSGWLATAFRVKEKYPQDKYVSISIPTWLYGHEPSTPFATHIAKFFENSIREDTILTYAFGGIIYTPGSAGTIQEVFQDAVQNHYVSFGVASPMVFMGKTFWTEEMPVYPLLEELVAKGKYKNLMMKLTDNLEEIRDFLTAFSNSLSNGSNTSVI